MGVLDDLGTPCPLRPAGEADRVADVPAQVVAAPTSTAEAAALLRACHARGLAVTVRGAGTKLHWGGPPRRLDVLLDTTALDALVEHAHGDLVATTGAGMRLAALDTALAEHGQQLVLDDLADGSTIGGALATGMCGPRRMAVGAPRDLLIGVRLVRADGVVAKAGGKVVKNVAGYDLSKLFTGSAGALGVISEANFRLHPLPEAARTVAVEVEDAQRAGEASQAIMGSQVEPSAVELHWRDGRGTLAALVEGISSGVEAQSATLRNILSEFGEVRALSDEEAGALGSEPPPQTADDVALKVSAYPAGLADVLREVENAAGKFGLASRVVAHAASGVANVGLSGGDEASRAEAVGEIRGYVTRRYPGGSVVVLRAPAGVKRAAEVWGGAGDRETLIRRVKERFDPRGTMSPGRFIGGM